MDKLSRVEAACLAFFRAHGICPDAKKSSVEAGLTILRDEGNRVIACLTEGTEVSESVFSVNGIGMAKVQNFLIRIHCHACKRSTVRDAASWVAGEVWDCSNDHRNVLPSSPLVAVRLDQPIQSTKPYRRSNRRDF